MGYNLLINGVYWGYNPVTNHLPTSWDIQVIPISLVQASKDLYIEVIGHQKPTQKTFSAGIWKTRIIIAYEMLSKEDL